MALTGRDLTIEQIVMVARHGAKVELSAEARRRESDNYGLLLEAAAGEQFRCIGYNRGAGDQRETVMFDGDPLSAANRPGNRSTAARRLSRRRVVGYWSGSER